MKLSLGPASAMLAICLSGVAGISLFAQDATPQPSPPGGPRPPADHGRPPRRPPPPLMEALDTDRDGTLSAEEITNASASLKKLDKNADGKLTEDELRPPPPPRDPNGGPPPRGRQGPGNQSRNEDASQGQDGPAMTQARPHRHHESSDETDADAPRFSRDQRDRRPPGPPPVGLPPIPEQDGPGGDVRPHAPASARMQRPLPPRLPDDPVALRLQQTKPVDDEQPARSGVAQSPLFDLLDANHDGTLSEGEKHTALAVLKALDPAGAERGRRDGLRPPLPPPGMP